LEALDQVEHGLRIGGSLDGDSDRGIAARQRTVSA
jgi:hypothetical protein